MQRALPSTLFLVEDSVPLRERLRDLVQIGGAVRVVGEAATPSEAIDGILAERPEFVVLDYQLDGGTGIDVLRATTDLLPGIVFIVLTNHVDAHTRRVCQAAGARFFLDKTTEFDRIGAIVAQVRSENNETRPAGGRSR